MVSPIEIVRLDRRVRIVSEAGTFRETSGGQDGVQEIREIFVALEVPMGGTPRRELFLRRALFPIPDTEGRGVFRQVSCCRLLQVVVQFQILQQRM